MLVMMYVLGHRRRRSKVVLGTLPNVDGSLCLSEPEVPETNHERNIQTGTPGTLPESLWSNRTFS
jgi:hypothetical protein